MRYPPRQIKHLLHPKHPPTLFYDDNWWCKLSILTTLDKNGKVKYLRHKHFSIILDDKENEVCCGVCDQKRSICSPSYDCNRCNFFIHQDCLEPTEEEVQQPFHPHDRLIVVSRKILPRRKFTCEACHNRCSGGFSYRCKESDYMLDVHCASLKPTTIKYTGHEHLLTFLKKKYDDPQCEICKSGYRDVSYLRCVECDFTVHLLCVPLPTTIKHKCHIDSLYLEDYFVEDDSEEYYCKIENNSYLDEYYCDACENIRNPRECVIAVQDAVTMSHMCIA